MARTRLISLPANSSWHYPDVQESLLSHYADDRLSPALASLTLQAFVYQNSYSSDQMLYY